jgi:hypothetical protein
MKQLSRAVLLTISDIPLIGRVIDATRLLFVIRLIVNDIAVARAHIESPKIICEY